MGSRTKETWKPARRWKNPRRQRVTGAHEIPISLSGKGKTMRRTPKIGRMVENGPRLSSVRKHQSVSPKIARSLNDVAVSSFTFISPVSSSMIAPAVNAISAELNITNDVEKNLTLSIFVLAYAVGPLFLGPLSEMYGRVIILQVTNLLYLFFNLGCGLAQTKGQLIAFRFLAGLGGSAPLVRVHDCSIFRGYERPI